MLPTLFAVVLVAAQVWASTPSTLSCKPVSPGYLVLEASSYDYYRRSGLGPALTSHDKSNDSFITTASPYPRFTLETCNSTYMGFPPSIANGRWKLDGKCITAESDGALALKKCTTKDDKGLLSQFFSTSLTATGNSTARGSRTQLIGYRANETAIDLYTTISRHNRTDIISQTVTPPPNTGHRGPPNYTYHILFYQPSKDGRRPFGPGA
ncbi:hypothetical protein EXIGLDRAFT_756040, partial [Exidia glandulosa HHB12029]